MSSVGLDGLIGTWYQVLDSTTTIEFTKDGYYYDSRYNKHSDSLKVSIGKLDGTIKEENFGRLRYKEIGKEDEIRLLSIYGDKNDIEFKRKGYIIEEENQSLIEIVYKMGEGISEHIQYGVQYEKVGGEVGSIVKLKDSLILVLEENFDKELFLIAFNQRLEDSNVQNIDKQRKVTISNKGYERINLKENLKVLLDGTVRSYKMTDNDLLKPIYTVQANEWQTLIKHSISDGIQETTFPVPLDSTIIFSSCRFNPSRAFVNKTFKQEIFGNVLDFRYSTFREELGYLGIH